MAGYNGFSKSNNAVTAEQEYKFPASVTARKLGVSTKAIQEFLCPCEWHHTSNYYNKTDYYDIEVYLALKNSEDIAHYCYDEQEKQEYIETWEKLRSFKPEKPTENIYKAKVKYLEWSGSRRYPKATEYKFENIEVTEKGQFYTFKTPHGNVRKKIGSNGTEVTRI